MPERSIPVLKSWESPLISISSGWRDSEAQALMSVNNAEVDSDI